MVVATQVMTIEEFWDKSSQFSHSELVRGEVVQMTPTGGEHGRLEFVLSQMLGRHLETDRRGEVFTGEVGFVLSRNPDTVRAPDLAFVSFERLPKAPRGFVPIAPDLAVEILSPGNTAGEIQSKVIDYMRAGTRAVWVVDPDTRTVTVYRSLSEIRVLTEEDTLSGADVLPGFAVPVKSIFA